MAARKGNRLPSDANGNPIQVALSIQMADISGSVKTSPLTTITTVQTFVPPANAVVFWFRGDVAGKFGDNATLDGTAGNGYGSYLVDTWHAIPCAGGNSIYVIPDSSAQIDFYFEVVE